MRRLDIRHVTEYLFSARVSLLPHQLLLRPRENHNVRIESSILFAKYTIPVRCSFWLQGGPNSTLSPGNRVAKILQSGHRRGTEIR
jgi:hypothetical protein